MDTKLLTLCTDDLRVIPPDRIAGRIKGENPPASVDIHCDGRHWATIPVIAGEHGPTFECQLPPSAEPVETSAEIRDPRDSTLLGALIVPPRDPVRNAHGLSAYDVLKVHGLPVLAVPWLAFDGACLTITGAHLPPAGDPGQLRVVFGPGVAFDFAYPLHSPEFSNHFWFWPNANLSAFVLKIHLPACAAGSNPFVFHFEYGNGDPLSRGSGRKGDPLSRQVAIPPRLDAGICLPRDETQLTRVQTWSNDQTVSFTGYSAYKTIEVLLARHGVSPKPGLSILDWGCGHGRVARHFIQNWPEANVFGADVDAENVTWCAKHLNGQFQTLPLLPPCKLEAGSFDAIFGISVMTHLTAEVQAAWLDEIVRLLKPDGIALISFAGPGATAWSSVFRTPEWWRDWIGSEFDDSQPDPALDGRIADNSYYRNTLQTPGYTRRVWSKHVEILDIVPDLMGNQDVVVLRALKTPSSEPERRNAVEGRVGVGDRTAHPSRNRRKSER